MYADLTTDGVRAFSEELPGWVLSADEDGAAYSNEPIENGYDVEQTCEHCGQQVGEDADGDECPEAECPTCEGSGEVSDDKTHMSWVECPDCDGVGSGGSKARHELKPAALSWVNSVQCHIDPERDEVWVSISLGDPRGAFVMRAERVRWSDEDGNHDEIRLSVPHPEQSLLHEPLAPLASPGYYRVSR